MSGRVPELDEPFVEPLTRREREILGLLDQGLSAPEIAAQLTLATSSVKSHIQHVYGKLGVNGKRQALTRAKELGLLTAPSPAPGPESSSPPARQQPARLGPAPRHNLPAQVTQFFGREDEIARLKQHLSGHRLVTLTGSGGVGKTRLSLRVAEEVLDDFPDGVWLVELAPLADPALVPQALATVLGVQEQPGRAILATLTSYLRDRKLLIVLDNCEHLIAACARLAESVLAACPHIRLLATSREALDIGGELAFHVRPLAAPDSHDQRAGIDTLTQFEAVQLFVDRAATALPGFALTPANAPAVAQVCHQLDGLPLAIEMAAARVKLLRVEEIAERLNDRFQLLTGGRRTALPRHQSLAAVIDWSYDLLSEPERALLRRLCVFSGGWTLEAAEAICAGEQWSGGAADILDLLSGLVNKSLVAAERRAGQETRYHSLETIRQYALPRLAASGDEETTRGRHARYYRSEAETADPQLYTAQGRRWLDRLAADLDNFRAAVAWSHTTKGDPQEGLRIAGGLFEYWTTRGPMSEGLAWLEAGLALAVAVTDPVRTRALRSAGWLAQLSGDFARASQHFKACVQLSRTIGDRWSLGWALSGLGLLASNRRDDNIAQALLTESLALFRESRDKLGIAYQQFFLGQAARARGDFTTAKAQYAESLRDYKQLGYLAGVIDVTLSLGELARAERDDVRAAAFFDQALAMGRELDYTGAIPGILISRAQLAHHQGDDVRAKTLLLEGLAIVRDYDTVLVAVAYYLAGLGGVSTAQRQPKIGVTLLSASSAAFDAIGRRMGDDVQADYDRDLAAAREQLGEEAFAAAWAEGQAMTPEQAIELALRT